MKIDYVLKKAVEKKMYKNNASRQHICADSSRKGYNFFASARYICGLWQSISEKIEPLAKKNDISQCKLQCKRIKHICCSKCCDGYGVMVCTAHLHHLLGFNL